MGWVLRNDAAKPVDETPVRGYPLGREPRARSEEVPDALLPIREQQAHQPVAERLR